MWLLLFLICCWLVVCWVVCVVDWSLVVALFGGWRFPALLLLSDWFPVGFAFEFVVFICGCLVLVVGCCCGGC